MTPTVRKLGSLLLALTVISFCGPLPASAITVELAKKCREMAVKAHPPPLRLGNQAYAQAEREFFAQCVSHDGNLDIPDSSNSDDTGAKDGDTAH
jgi:hypothetical protein